MSLKEMAEYDPHIKQVFGKVECGGEQDLGESEQNANEALVCMLVGLRSYWKIPIAYFLIKSVSGSTLAGLIRECLIRCFQVCNCNYMESFLKLSLIVFFSGFLSFFFLSLFSKV